MCNHRLRFVCIKTMGGFLVKFSTVSYTPTDFSIIIMMDCRSSLDVQSTSVRRYRMSPGAELNDVQLPPAQTATRYQVTWVTVGLRVD